MVSLWSMQKEKVMAEFCIRLRRSLYLASVAKIRLSFSSAMKEKSRGDKVSSNWFALSM